MEHVWLLATLWLLLALLAVRRLPGHMAPANNTELAPGSGVANEWTSTEASQVE